MPASGASPRWRQAFFGEAFVWSFALGLAAFVPTYDVRLFFLFLGLGLLAKVLFNFRRRSEAL